MDEQKLVNDLAEVIVEELIKNNKEGKIFNLVGIPIPVKKLMNNIENTCVLVNSVQAFVSMKFIERGLYKPVVCSAIPAMSEEDIGRYAFGINDLIPNEPIQKLKVPEDKELQVTKEMLEKCTTLTDLFQSFKFDISKGDNGN